MVALALRVVLGVSLWVAVCSAGPTPSVGPSLQDLLRSYQQDQSNALLCEQIGVLYTRQNDLGQAAIFFRKSVALDPNRIPSRKNLATVLWFLGKKEEAAALFTSLERSVPQDPVPHLYLALSEYDRKNMEKAALHFERAGVLASDNPETLPLIVQTYLATGRAAQVCALLEERIASGDSAPQTYRWLGDAYDAQVQPEKAFRAYSDAIEQVPNDEESYLALAGFCIEHANTPLARDALTRGLQQIPGSAKLLLELGLAWAIQGDFGKAKQYFLEANASESSWSLPLLALGVTNLQTGDAGHAAECFRKAKDVAPDDYRCYYLHAVALNRSQVDQNQASRLIATSELQHAIALNPHSAKARVALADTLIADNRLSPAEAELREAVRIDPSESTALYKLAMLYRREGKTQAAQPLLKAFQQSKSKSHDEENEFVLILKTVK